MKKNYQVGQHVMVGRHHETFNVPKHLAVVRSVNAEELVCETSEGKFTTYARSEAEGLRISEEILLSCGFIRSKLQENRYIWTDPVEHFRLVYNLKTCTVSGNAMRYAEASNVRYVDELETIISFIGINIKMLDNGRD